MKVVKYVIDNDGVPILFYPKISHSSITEIALSAGFALIIYDSEFDKFFVKCFGGSDSLKIKFSNHDYIIIQDYLNCL